MKIKNLLLIFAIIVFPGLAECKSPAITPIYQGNIIGSVTQGASSFNNAKLLQKRQIFLNYRYVNTATGYTWNCTDTLTFRNRIRDGINEWQDEDPSHYLK